MTRIRRGGSRLFPVAAALWIASTATFAAGLDSGAVKLDAVQAALKQAEERLRPLLGGTDLADGLYFGWNAEPRNRATLAVAVKATAALRYEQRLRRVENGAIPDADLLELMDWLDQAPQRIATPRKNPRPIADRSPGWLGGLGAEPHAPVYTFVDRSTATRRDPVFGDMDLLASMGFPAYATPPPEAARPAQWRATTARADGLGVEILLVGNGDTEVRGRPHLRSLPLTEWLDPSEIGSEGQLVPAVMDPPRGETWPEALARRGLCRGMSGGPTSVTLGVVPPRDGWLRKPSAEQMALTMWLHALDGQRLGVIEGWRDPRDGSAVGFPSLTANPVVLETAAHTALDLLDRQDLVRSFWRRPKVAVLVDLKAISEEDANRWAAPYVPLFASLCEAQIRFDVLSAGKEAGADSYNAVVSVLAEAGGSSSVTIGKAVTWSPGADPDATVAALKRLLPAESPSGFRVIANSQAGLLVLHSAAPAVAIANLGDDRVTFRVEAADGSPASLDDVVSGESMRDRNGRVTCEPQQLRLLVPQRP